MVVAVPVAPIETADEIRTTVDEFVCLDEPKYFMAGRNYYRNFTQVTDEEVAEILRESEASKKIE